MISRRRALIAFAFAAVGGPLCSIAQQPTKPRRIGALWFNSRPVVEELLKAFEEGMREHGWINGKNLAIEHRFAEGKVERLSALAAELEKLGVELIATGLNPSIRAALDATARVPIVAALGANMVEAGFAASLARPGGRVTGLTFVLGTEVYGKRLQILQQAVPKVSRIAMLWDSSYESSPGFKPEIERTASALKLHLVWITISANDDADAVVARALSERADSLFSVGGQVIWGHRKRLTELAAMRRLPAIYDSVAYVEVGGLLAYAPSTTGGWRECARYVDKSLKGAKPGELPIERPSKFETLVNLTAAKQLGIKLSPAFLQFADRVIQ